MCPSVKLRRLLVVAGLILPAAVLLHGCDLLTPADKRAVVRSLTDSEKAIVEADHHFGFSVFRAISESEPDKSMFISPLSMSMALGMTLNGARGETRDQMLETLALAGLSETEINESYRSVIDLLRGLDPKVKFEIANSIWHRRTFQPETAFLDVNRQYFDAEVQGLDFDSPEAVETINAWVEESTDGKIDKIIESIARKTVMYLINAIYFNGTWTYEFKKSDTRELPFTTLEGKDVDVPMMAQEAHLPYFENETLQTVDLPYGDSLYSMSVILPRKGVDVNALASGMDTETWTGWVSRLKPRRVSLRLPRFQLEYKIELKDVLSSLGMSTAFDPDFADFTGIHRDGNLFINSVLHKTFVQVDEEGTEAAAVTSVDVAVDSVGGGTQMHVDRPFIFVIRERHSGTILFIGKVLSL